MDDVSAPLSHEQLLSVISLQSEVARLGVDLSGITSLIVEKIPALIAADGAVIEYAEGEDMVYRAVSGLAEHSLGLRLRRESSLSGLCVREGLIQVCQDSETDNRVDREACRRVGLRSMVVLPLRHGSRTVGVLKAMSSRPEAFSSAQVRILSLLSDTIGAAMFHSARFDANELFYRATHDFLTGLPNGSMFMDRLRTLLEQAKRRGEILAVMMADLDGLKTVNDRWGHKAGDALLREFARRITAMIRQSDTVARLGGDEFAGIFHPLHEKESMSQLLERFREALDPEFAFEGHSAPMSASFGVALFPEDSGDIGVLCEMADARMYGMKKTHHQEQLLAGGP